MCTIWWSGKIGLPFTMLIASWIWKRVCIFNCICINNSTKVKNVQVNPYSFHWIKNFKCFFRLTNMTKCGNNAQNVTPVGLTTVVLTISLNNTPVFSGTLLALSTHGVDKIHRFVDRSSFPSFIVKDGFVNLHTSNLSIQSHYPTHNPLFVLHHHLKRLNMVRICWVVETRQ